MYENGFSIQNTIKMRETQKNFAEKLIHVSTVNPYHSDTLGSSRATGQTKSVF